MHLMDTDSTAFFEHLPRPEPAGGLEYYARERERALAFDPRRQENYDRYQEYRRDDPNLNFMPIKLDIENASRCNFRCTMCAVSSWDKGKRAEDMPFEEFKALIDSQYGLVEIKLQGLGEPTMQGEDYFRMIRYARSQKIWVRTTTNASLLHLKDNYKKLIDSDPNEVQISVDGADEQTFTSIRRGAVFKQVIKNCKLINDYSREVGVRRTKMWVVVQKKNAHQLDKLIDLAADIGFTNMVFSFDMHGFGEEVLTDQNRREMVEREFDEKKVQGLIDRGRSRGLDVWFWTVSDKYKTNKPENLCPWPFERSFVSSDLRVVPCCMISNPQVIDLGDGTDFSEVWHSPTMEHFRKDHITGNIPDVCKLCYATR